MSSPTNPAPVGLPGALSQRTDGGPSDKQPMRALPDAQYGEGKQFEELQQGAPMAAQPAPFAATPPTGLFEPTQRPQEPVTSGIDSGPGVGAEAPRDPKTQQQQDAALILGYLPALRRAASKQGAPGEFKQFVQYVETFNR